MFYYRKLLPLVCAGVFALPAMADEQTQTLDIFADTPATTIQSEQKHKSIMFADSTDTAAGLVQAIRATLVHNPAIKSQRTEIQVQEEAVDVAKSAWYPSITGSVSSDEDDTSYFEFDQPLWTFGKNSSATEAERVALGTVKQGLVQVQRTLMEETANAYTLVQATRLKIAVAKDNFAEHQRLYKRIQNRHAMQLASQADVNLANSRLLQVRADLLNYKAQLQSVLNELYTLTRVPVNTEIPVDLALATLPDEDEIRRIAIKENADISYAEKEVSLANAQYEMQKSSPFPTISFNVQQFVMDEYDDNETYMGITLTGSVNGLGLTAYNQIQGAEKSIIAAQYNLDSVRNDVVRETDNYLVNIELQKGLRDSQAMTVMALEETMGSFLRQYEVDRKTWVEVLNQQRELANMRYTLIDTDRQYMLLSLQLAIKTGRLDDVVGVNEVSGEFNE